MLSFPLPAEDVVAHGRIPHAGAASAEEDEASIAAAMEAAGDIHLAWRMMPTPAGGEAQRVLAVLHDLSLAAAWCDRVLVLEGGTIVADGAPHAVLDGALVSRVWGISVRRLEGGSVRDIAFLAA